MRKFSKDGAIRKLPPGQCHVTQQNGTEAGTGEYLDNKERLSTRTFHALSSSAEVSAASTPRSGSHGRR